MMHNVHRACAPCLCTVLVHRACAPCLCTAHRILHSVRLCAVLLGKQMCGRTALAKKPRWRSHAAVVMDMAMATCRETLRTSPCHWLSRLMKAVLPASTSQSARASGATTAVKACAR